MASNVKHFHEKLALLNREFVDFIAYAVKENASYDLTPSVQDYLKHVRELDKTYAPPTSANRKVLTAKRRTGDGSASAASPAPAKITFGKPPTPKKLSDGKIEPAGQFSFAPKVTMPPVPTFAPAPVSSSTPLNRKRRNLENLDYDKMRDTSSEDYGKADPEPKPAVVPEGIKRFQEQIKKGSPLFSAPAKESDKPVSLFSSPPPKPAAEAPKPTLDFFSALKKPAVTAESKDAPAKPSPIANIFSTAAPANPLFPLAKPGGQPGASLFGSLLKPTGGPITFGTPPASNPASGGENAAGAGEDAAEAPPKVDAVQHSEPDSVFSTKCSVFNFKDGEYVKAGIGFIYIKKADKGAQLLIRAATATGNVLVNTFVNDAFKATKQDKNRIRFSYPTPDGVHTHVVRVIEADYEEAFKYLSGAKKP